MSEVTVLDIPLQGSLTPTVGTYTGEGRSDTTFNTDNTLNEQYLYSPDRNHTGYYYYYPLTIPDGITLKIELDINIRSDWLACWILLFNLGTDNWWGISKDYDNAALNIHDITGLLLDVYRETMVWHHILCTFQKTSENITITLEDTNDASSIRTATIPVNDSNYRDYSITNVALLGNENTSSSCPDCFVKKIRMYYELPVRTLLVHIGNEICKAYSELPEEYASTLKGTINFEHLLTAEGVLNDNNIYEYTIPLDNAIDKSIIFMPTGRNELITKYHSILYDNSFNDYVLYDKLYNSHYRICFFPKEMDTLGTDNIKRICIEFKVSVTNWNGSNLFFLISLGGEDPANNGTSNALRLCCNNMGKIVDESSNNPMTTNIFNQNDLNIALNTIYKITVYAEINFLKNELKVKVYIDNNLRYTGTSTPSTFSIGTDMCFFYKQWLSTTTQTKRGSINIYSGYPNTWHRKLNVKHNNNLYYLLASNTGLYPSRLRAKIDGITYPILLKHDEDNTSE